MTKVIDRTDNNIEFQDGKKRERFSFDGATLYIGGFFGGMALSISQVDKLIAWLQARRAEMEKR